LPSLQEIDVEFVTSLAFCRPDELAPLCRAADEAGFFGASVSDHLVHPRDLKTPYPYTEDGKPRWEPFTDWPDPWVTIGHLAAHTQRLRFHTSIFVLPMRNPVHVAKAIGTAAVLSGGRVALGIGVGWMEEEFALSEQPFARRGVRTDEMIQVMRTLWQGGWVEHHGEFYDFDALEMSPVPEAEIPIWGGGISEPALRRAALRCDGWISDLHSIAELKDYAARLTVYRADSERGDRPFSLIGSCNDAYDLDGYRRLEDAGVTHLNTMPWAFYAGPEATLAEKCDGIRRFGDDIVSMMP
jgi:probable F420-dependent oxidoreductase